SGGIGQSCIVLPAALRAFCKSFRIQFATLFGLLAPLAAASKYLASSRSFARTLASYGLTRYWLTKRSRFAFGNSGTRSRTSASRTADFTGTSSGSERDG